MMSIRRLDIKESVHSLFVSHPRLGCHGYELVRRLKKDDGTKRFLRGIESRGFSPKSILDVGAYRGEWSRNARAIFWRARYFLVEPLAEMRPFLERFCVSQPGSKFFLAGAGAEPGELVLSTWGHKLSQSSLLRRAPSVQERLALRSVPIVTIDSLIQENEIPVPDFVKVDVQGSELEVLRGSSECFGHTEVFFVEVWFFEHYEGTPLFHEVVEFMLQRDYVVYDVPRLIHRPLDGALGAADFCFVKRNGLLRTGLLSTSSAWE